MSGVAIGLDVGTSGAKGLAVAPDGAVVARAERGYPLSTPRPGWAEQDPEDWWRASAAVLEELQAAAGAPAGIGLSGQMHGLVALDGADRVLRPAILWNDQRTAAECAEIEQRLGFERLVALTGNRALTGFTAPKLLWLRRHEPDVYERVAAILLPKDYVRLRLCGERAGDVTDASGTLLFDVGARAWSTEVCAALEVDPAWLPAALESPRVSGTTDAGVPVAAGAGDQAAAALGAGIVAPGGPASVVLGTSGVVFAALEGYTPDPQARAHTFCHAVPGAWHAMGVALSAAGSLRWLRDVAAPGAEYDALTAEAAAWAPGVEGLTFLPYLAGERTPHADPAARGSFTGLALRHDRGALVRAVLEGVGLLAARLPRRAARGRRRAGDGHRQRRRRPQRAVATDRRDRARAAAGPHRRGRGRGLRRGAARRRRRRPVARSRPRRWPPPCARPRSIEPEPAWADAYAALRARYRALYPALSSIEEPA